MRRYTLDTRVLTVFFFVAMPFVAFGSFVVVSMARGMLQESVGAGLEQQALETRLILERHVSDQITHLHLLTLDPQVRQAVTASPLSRTPEAAQRLEEEWAAGTEPKLTASLLQSLLAGRLREVVQAGVGPKLLQLVDSRGQLVATSGRGGRLVNAETAWFKFLASREYLAPQAYVGDIHRPQAGSAAIIEIAYPLTDPAEGRFLGALRALLDVSDFYAILAPLRVGGSSDSYVYTDAPRTFLVRSEDGMLLAAEDSRQVLTERFPGFPSLQAAMQLRRGYWTVPEIRERGSAGQGPEVRPARLVAYSPVDKVPNAQWLVVVERDLANATAPVQAVTRYLWIHFIGAFATVILLALYFSFKLEEPVIDEKLHLHEEHVPSSMRPRET